VDTETPIYNTVTILGKISFEKGNKKYIALRCNSIINKGEFMIGEDDKHYKYEAQVHIYGEGITNYGSMRMYGWYRNSAEISRLTKSIAPGDKTLMIERDFDIRKGEMIAVLTNTFDQSATERHTVLSYDKDSGKIVLNGTEFAKEHWGD
jgi:hypothetical protein